MIQRVQSRRVSHHWQYASARMIATLTRPLKLAIIGAGPSGFYTASRILSLLPIDSPNGKNAEVHMYERLPTPYGLVRYGVAPDHPEVKNCQHKFDELAQDPRFKYFGNVLISSQPSSTPTLPTPSNALSPYTYPHALRLSFSDILPYYSTLVLTYGASLSNPLHSVSGSSSSAHPLQGVYPALAFVSWYNSHPAFADLPVDLRGVKQVSVVGQGNVALDVARLLLKSIDSLRSTDLSEDVLHVLSQSTVEHVRVVGRRGPGQVAFTTKELRELLALPDLTYHGVDERLIEDAMQAAAVQGGNEERMRKRLLGLMEKKKEGGKKIFELDFLKSPSAFLPSALRSSSQTAQVSQVEWAYNRLDHSPAGTIATSTGSTTTYPADMVIESVGYRSEPLTGPPHEWDLPFDTVKGRIMNDQGRVKDALGNTVPGVYAAGWAARGPVGVIASTMHDAYSLSSLILQDHFDSPDPSPSGRSTQRPRETLCQLNSCPEPGFPERIEKALRNQEDKMVVDLRGWAKIDLAERKRAEILMNGKDREKFRRVEEMLAVLQ
ncbi:hypothetical protein L204_102632 [Cryptococcus depauperatus]